MRSDDEILAMLSFTLTQDEQRRKRVLEDERYQQALVDQAYTKGKLDLLKEQTLADEGLREDLRLQQWVKQKNHGITYDRANDTFNDVPDGWPDGMDGDQFVADFVDSKFATTTKPQPQTEDTSSVAAFNKSIGE